MDGFLGVYIGRFACHGLVYLNFNGKIVLIIIFNVVELFDFENFEN